jgi:hypothetical protein
VAKKKQKRDKAELVGFLGVGLDNTDEHARITRTDHFVIVGGSEETHGQMQDTAIRFNDSLRQKGKELREVSPQEAIELLQRALES